MVVTTKAGKKGVKILGEGTYPLVPLKAIELAERPEEGKESNRIFFNPRALESFDSKAMTELRESIRQDGLVQPPVVRVSTSNNKKDGDILRVELVAGERRFRSISKLWEDNAECYDEDSQQMRPAREVYEHVPCKVLYNISDQTALRIAFKENNEHKSLTIKEEISLVERLSSIMKQEEICDLLRTNVTWVSQTANFRKELPVAAFEKLMIGKLSRHVAVQILSFRPQDRERLYAETVRAEEEERVAALNAIRDEIEFSEDAEDIALSEQEMAIRNGKIQDVKKAKKKATTAAKKLQKAKDKEAKIHEGEGVIKQGHIAVGSQLAGVSPKKAKMLARSDIEQFYVDLLGNWQERGKECPILKLKMPEHVLKIMKMTAEAILNGQHDPAAVIRNFLIAQGEWTVPEGVVLPTLEPTQFEDE